MRSMRLLAATAALTVSSVAVAGPNYTYAQLGFFTADSEGKEDSGGFELNGSFGFADLFHVGAGISAGEWNGGRSKQSNCPAPAATAYCNPNAADTDSYELYVGVNPAITDNVDAIVRVGYAASDFKGKAQFGVNVKGEDEALFLAFGTRAMITEKFELNAFATYAAGSTKVKEFANSKTDFVDWSYTVGGIYNFTDMFAAGIKLELETPLRLINFADNSTVEIGSVGTLFARVNF